MVCHMEAWVPSFLFPEHIKWDKERHLFFSLVP
jgi:hypothetical protein